MFTKYNNNISFIYCCFYLVKYVKPHIHAVSRSNISCKIKLLFIFYERCAIHRDGIIICREVKTTWHLHTLREKPVDKLTILIMKINLKSWFLFVLIYCLIYLMYLLLNLIQNVIDVSWLIHKTTILSNLYSAK